MKNKVQEIYEFKLMKILVAMRLTIGGPSKLEISIKKPFIALMIINNVVSKKEP
jgi:hypothetical protein